MLIEQQWKIMVLHNFQSKKYKVYTLHFIHNIQQDTETHICFRIWMIDSTKYS